MQTARNVLSSLVLMRGASLAGWRTLGVSLLVLGLVGACSSEDRRAPFAGSIGDISTSVPPGLCSRAATGCTCDSPGELIECGEISRSSGDYVTCSQGRRLCGDDLRWSECSGEVTFTKLAASVPPPGARTLALGAQQRGCTPEDVCDPYCMAFSDTPSGLPSLTPGLCERANGLELCNNGCGYAGVHSVSEYSDLPSAWQSLAESCSLDNDCSFDRRCGDDDTCVPWESPNCSATSAEGSCTNAIDLVAGPPCTQASDGFHVQVCNRGSVAATSGVIRVGLYADPELVGLAAGDVAAAAPDFELAYTLGEGARSLLPGTCIDLHEENIDAEVAPELPEEPLGVLVNYTGEIAECKTGNNWNVLDPDAVCSTCTGLACEQQCSETTLTGTIRDPAGKNPLPNVMVYVPSTDAPLAAFPNGVSREDRCALMYSGSPIAATLTGANGEFSLTNVPTGTSFPLVIQLGRWRRQVTVPAIPACGTATLAPDLARLPRTQRRTSGSTTSGEGDIPQMALVLADADPLQCTLRNIGIAETEFTNSNGPGRVHLYNHNGMTQAGAAHAYNGDEDGLFVVVGDDGAELLRRYNLVLAPCDGQHTSYISGGNGGPSYNSYPNPTANEDHRANVETYINAGGRLLTTHWMSLDFVHLIYPHDNRPPYYTPVTPPPSGWTYVDPATYRSSDSPLVHQFGDNVTAGGNWQETPSTATPTALHGGKPGPDDSKRFTYTIDASTPLGQLFQSWATTTGASTEGAGTVTFNSWLPHLRAVRQPGIRLAFGNSNLTGPRHPGTWGTTGSWGGEHVSMFQFDTPWNAATPTGRVVGLEAHVAEHPTCRIVLGGATCQSGLTPPDCGCIELPGTSVDPATRTARWNTACGAAPADAPEVPGAPGVKLAALSPQEKAFEFLFFSANQCVGALQAPSPHPPTNLSEASYTRRYHAVCPSGRPTWRDFLWQGTLPPGTAIDFYAQAGLTQRAADDADPVLLATVESSAAQLTSLEETVDAILRREDETLASLPYLNIIIRLKPNGASTPTLTQWQQRVDCVPSE